MNEQVLEELAERVMDELRKRWTAPSGQSASRSDFAAGTDAGANAAHAGTRAEAAAPKGPASRRRNRRKAWRNFWRRRRRASVFGERGRGR